MLKKSIFFVILVLAFMMMTSANADTLPLLFFDDFSGDTINGSLWSVNDPSDIFTQSGGFLKADSPPNSTSASIKFNKNL